MELALLRVTFIVFQEMSFTFYKTLPEGGIFSDTMNITLNGVYDELIKPYVVDISCFHNYKQNKLKKFF